MENKMRTAFIRVVSFSAAAVAVLGALLVQSESRLKAGELSSAEELTYQRAFSEIVSSVEDMNYSLEKALYITSPALSVGVYSELYSQSRSAAACLGILPFSNAELEKTSAFVSRVGDYSYFLSKKAASGQALEPEEAENLKTMSAGAAALAEKLVSMQEAVYAQGLSIASLSMDAPVGRDAGEGTVQAIENDFMESPSLVYDGPFSEHIEAMEPRFIKGKAQVTAEEAREKAEVFFDLKPGTLSLLGEAEGRLPAYIFQCGDNSGKIHVQVTKTGGEILYMSREAAPEDGGLSREGAVERAKKFLDENGVSGMKDTYTQRYGGAMVINFAYTANGIMCYSDLVKVTLAMDTGDIIGYEARGYIMSHTKRELPEAQISAQQASEAVSGELKVLDTQLCVIPTAGKNEIYCIELKCENADGKHYLLYVNAMTGAEEKLLILLENEDGTLSV